MKITAKNLLELGVVDGIVKEPLGGAQSDYDEAASNFKASILENLNELSQLSSDEIMNQRYDRFRALGEIG